MEPRSPVHETRSQGEVPLLDATAVLEQESGTVAPSQQDRLKVTDGQVEVVLPPLSWNMLRLLPADDEVRPPR